MCDVVRVDEVRRSSHQRLEFLKITGERTETKRWEQILIRTAKAVKSRLI